MVLIAVIIAAIVSVACHLMLRSFWGAVAGSAVISVVLFWALSMSHFGWLDQTFFENVAWSLLLSAGVSLVVGKVVRKLEKKRGET